MHIRKVDASVKIAETKKKWSTVAEMSIHNEEFYIDFQKLGLALNQDAVFQQV